MAPSRREFLRHGLGTAAGLVAAQAALAVPTPQPPAHDHSGHTMNPPPGPAPAAAPKAPGVRRAAAPKGTYVPVEVPDVPKLPWTWDGGVKVFRLSCDVVEARILPWKPLNVWGYNGSMPGPTVEVVEGDRVRFIVENHLPEATTLHWHGLEVPIEMDGVEGISQDFIKPGESFVYEFTLHQNGTFFYHSHRPMQQMMGMIGLFIVHPRQAHAPRCDRDFGLILQEFSALPSNPTPNSMAMEFNWLTINGKSGPANTPLLVRQGERVRLRFVNLGMDHHPIHMHGHTWLTTGTEGGRIPRGQWRPGNTELVGVAQARDVEFDARYVGDWMIHCHLPHHMMNAMASMAGPLSQPAPGVPSGGSMEDGMGMMHDGHALSHDAGPALGRTTGVNADQRTSHLAGPSSTPGSGGAHSGHAGGPGTLPHQGGPEAVAPNARSVPGYPQDMYMVMDEAVAKPENHGLRPGWSGAMMGMMTLVRVMKPELYDKIQELKANGAVPAMPVAPQGHEGHRGGGAR